MRESGQDFSGPLAWEPLLPRDGAAVESVAARIHPTLPERAEVLREKIGLFGAGCRKLVLGGRVAGYGIAHPWILDDAPPLDTFLGRLPAEPRCLYVHDVAILPEARGRGAVAAYLDHLRAVAHDRGLEKLALVSVYGTDALWARFGFRRAGGTALGGKLATYGPTALYMVCDAPLQAPGR